MSYVDFQVYGNTATPTEVETGTGDKLSVTTPTSLEIEAVAFVVTEDFAAHATDPVFALDTTLPGGSRTERVTIALGSSQGSDLKQSDGDRARVTSISADTDLDAGDVVFMDLSAFPIAVEAGARIFIEQTTAAGEAGGAVVPCLIVRVEGHDLTETNIWTDE